MSDNLNQQADTGNQEQVNWREHIPADLKDKGYWKPLENADLPTVLKGYANAQERLGKSITLPDKPDDTEGWNKIYSRMGRPDAPDKYQYEIPKVEGLDWGEGAFDDFNKLAHSVGLSNDQVSKIVKWMGEDVQVKVKKQTDDAATASAVTETKLKNEFGKNYEINKALARRAGINYFGEEITNELLSGMNETVVRGLMKLGSQLAEDKAFGDNPVELQGAISKEDALRKIAEIGSDRKHPYWNSKDPRHSEAQGEFTELHKVAFPDF